MSLRGAWSRRLLAVLGAAAGVVSVASASASADTIGHTFDGVNICPAGVAFWEPSYAAPSAGEITSFSMQTRSSDSGERVAFLVLRPTNTPDTWTVVGKTGAETLAGSGGVETFTLPVPIGMQTGDAIGLYALDQVSTCGQNFGGAGVQDDFTSNPPIGATLTSAPAGHDELNLSADFTPGVMVDSHVSTPVTVTDTLTLGRLYTVTVQGTYSPWTAMLMSTPWWPYKVCGAPEDAPMFPSPGVTNGRVGSDAASIFAQALRYGCGTKLEQPWTSYKLLLNFAGALQAIPPTTSDPASHTYTYAVLGEGLPLQALISDSNYKDNYGQLLVVAVPQS